jgi:hypothetical protein
LRVSRRAPLGGKPPDEPSPDPVTVAQGGYDDGLEGDTNQDLFGVMIKRRSGVIWADDRVVRTG